MAERKTKAERKQADTGEQAEADAPQADSGRQARAGRRQAGAGRAKGGRRAGAAQEPDAEDKQADSGRQAWGGRRQAAGGRQARAGRGQGRGGRRQRGRSAAAAEAPGAGATASSDEAIESRLERIEQAVAGQSERSKELLGKLDEVLHEARKSARHAKTAAQPEDQGD